MPNVWLDSLTSFDDTLKQIEKCLVILKDNATKINFAEPQNKDKYSNDIMFMKQFFERAEFLIRNGDENGADTKKRKRKVKAQYIDTGLD